MAGRSVDVAVRNSAVGAVFAGTPMTEVARDVGVAHSTVRRWVARAARGEPLTERPRPGRPRIQDTADHVVAAVLATAGARIDSPDFSTRGVATATGLSQSVVSRSVRSFAGEAARPGTGRGADNPARGHVLSLVAVGYPVLVVGLDRVPGTVGAARSARALRRRSAALVAAVHAAGIDGWADRTKSDHRQVQEEEILRLLRSADPDRWLAFDPHGDLAEDDLEELSGEGAVHAHLDDFVAHVQTVLGSVADVPGSLLDLLAARVSRGLEGVLWSRGGQVPRSTDSKTFESTGLVPDSRWLPRENLSMTEQLAYALRQEIIDSGYRSGDRIRVRVLMHRLGVPRSALDAALRRMVDDELLDGSRGGFRIPTITARDVLDLYVARQALGTILLRGLAEAPRRNLVPVRQAFRRIEAVARTRRGDEVEDADLRFQQEIARASGLDQTARTFESLTRRLRMYISVLRLDYAPATERILYDDRRILSRLEQGDAAGAVDAWRGKIDNAVRHMSGTAAHRRFDVALWQRLSAPR